MSEENLWGELPEEKKIETPASILRAQAVALNKATKGILVQCNLDIGHGHG
jgi:hypothetical protein